MNYTSNFAVSNHVIVDDDGSFPHLSRREWWSVTMTVVPVEFTGPDGIIFGSLTSTARSRAEALSEVEKYLEQALADVRRERLCV